MISREEVFFPHEEIRPTQDSFLRAVKVAIDNKKNLLGHIPTGTGKTAASLAPALKYAIENQTTIFFLTPRHTQHKLAIETLKQIKTKYNLDFSVVDFIGKKWMCAMKGTDLLASSEFQEYCKEVRENGTCQYYSNYKDKTKIIPREVLIKQLKEEPLHVEELCKFSEEAKFCPFEIAGEVGKKSTVIVADYFHLLSPSIRESIFNRTESTLNNSIVILDEAQNLPDRCRDLLSTQLTTFTLDNAAKELSQFQLSLDYNINVFKEILNNLGKKLSIEEKEILIKKEDLVQEIERISPYEDIINDFELKSKAIREEKKKSYLFAVSEFLKAWGGPDKGFIRILKRGFSKQGKPFISLIYRCLDPSVAIKDLLEESRSIICMSGTLYPLEMYRDLLGFKEPIMIEYESPFPKENQLNLIVPETTTKYTRRGREMYMQIAEKCANMVESGKGNFVIFFPSYNILENVFIHFKELTTKKIFLERPGLSKIEKEELITKFKEEREKGGILMGVSAGNFGEGVDLPGDLLQGVIIVGLPLGKPDLETKELINYYDFKFGNGPDYGYVFPAITKCLQNAGRCIRSETDKGVIIFLDERYGWKNYKKYFPENMHFVLTKAPEVRIKDFFDNTKTFPK
tara:strand:+ start:11963 stop:13849 length:1887 start_codon:yes stop_codon:yes gene_type:complete